MRYSVEWTPGALDDIAALDNPVLAAKIQYEAERLQTNPDLAGRVIPFAELVHRFEVELDGSTHYCRLHVTRNDNLRVIKVVTVRVDTVEAVDDEVDESDSQFE